MILCPLFYFHSITNTTQSEQILQEVGNKLRTYPFNFRGAAILSGQEEGAYGWVTVNYLLENFVKVVYGSPTLSLSNAGKIGSVVQFLLFSKDVEIFVSSFSFLN